MAHPDQQIAREIKFCGIKSRLSAACLLGGGFCTSNDLGEHKRAIAFAQAEKILGPSRCKELLEKALNATPEEAARDVGGGGDGRSNVGNMSAWYELFKDSVLDEAAAKLITAAELISYRSIYVAPKPQPAGPFGITPDAAGITPDAAAQHTCAMIKEDVRIPIGNNIDGVRNDNIMEAIRNAYEMPTVGLMQEQEDTVDKDFIKRMMRNQPTVGLMQEQEDTVDKDFIKRMMRNQPTVVLMREQEDTVAKDLKGLMALFSAAATCSWAALPVLEKALGPKLAPYAYGAVCTHVTLLGGSAIAALVHKKSPRHKVFAKYGKLVFIAVSVALPIMVLSSMIVG